MAFSIIVGLEKILIASTCIFLLFPQCFSHFKGNPCHLNQAECGNVLSILNVEMVSNWTHLKTLFFVIQLNKEKLIEKIEYKSLIDSLFKKDIVNTLSYKNVTFYDTAV